MGSAHHDALHHCLATDKRRFFAVFERRHELDVRQKPEVFA
jgi:hypothetical protein